MPVANLEFVDRGLALAESAREQSIVLRILGSLAYRLHCPANLQLFDEMKRDLTDVDFPARGDQRKEIRAFLEGLGYEIDQDLLVATEGARYFFMDPASGSCSSIRSTTTARSRSTRHTSQSCSATTGASTTR